MINHLTRMGAPQICVAGIESKSGRHIRPVTGASNRLTRSMLLKAGGIFEVGAQVDLGQVTPRSSPPEVEDQLFWPDRAQYLGTLSGDEYLGLIDSVCTQDLASVFGGELVRDGWTATVPPGHGNASLGCIRVGPGAARLSIGRAEKVTLQLRDPEKPYYLPVTDLRCCEADHKTPRKDVVENVQRRISRGVPLRIMVGLSRAWSRDGDNDRHWLQVNGLCLEDSPLGDAP